MHSTIKPGMRIRLTLLMVFFVADYVWSEIPPYCPMPKTIPVGWMNRCIRPEEIRLTTSDGNKLVPSEFVQTRSLNDREWKFSGVINSGTPDNEGLNPGYYQPGFDDSKWDNIRVPLNWYVQYPKAYQSPGEFKKSYFKGCYRRKLALTPEELAGRRVILYFGVIGYEAKLYVNGQEAGGHHGDFVPWEVDITPWVRPGNNTLAIRVVSDFGVTPAVHTYGSRWAMDNFKAGLWQEVWLRLEPAVRLGRILIIPDLAAGGIAIEARIFNHTGKQCEYRPGGMVSAARRDAKETINASVEFPGMTGVSGENIFRGFLKLKNPIRWTPDNPFLYYLTVYLRDAKGKILSAKSERFGFRDFKIKGKNFYLNGERIYLFGENWPVVFYGGLGRTGEEEENRTAKDLCGYKSLGYNILRTSHMPALPVFYELADELGMLVYNEWSWSGINEIEEGDFSRRNDRELTEWVYRDYNHPSVVMWSGGNEVTYSVSPAANRQLDRQVDLIRALDKSGRPVGSFSGSASQFFGMAKLNTDFVDMHNYIGMAICPWTGWNPQFREDYLRLACTYAKDEKEFNKPYVIWECVGFSWGWHLNDAFRLNDVHQYAEYVAKENISSWGEHYGIGLAGSLGLDTALKKGVYVGRVPYGRRILGLIRQNPDVQGFAPWFSNPYLPEATIWNQPVYCGLRNDAYVPPHNLFSGRQCTRIFFIVNSTNGDLRNLRGEISLARENGMVEKIKEINLPEVLAWSQYAGPVSFKLPELPASERCQLRVTVRADGREVSRNFHEVFTQNPGIMTRKITSPRKTAVLNCGSREDTETTAAILKSLGIDPEVIDGNSGSFGKYDLLVVPAVFQNKRVALDEAALLKRVDQGGCLLILEQGEGKMPGLTGYTAVLPGNTFVDLVIPEHPVFRSLDQTCFDTWENPKTGYPVRYAISPFSLNALAVRGPLLERKGVGMAVMEATYGKGRIFASQLDAVRMWGRDSAATTYLVNLFNYLAGRELPYGKVQPLCHIVERGDIAESARLTPVDLRPYANRNFADQSDKGGPEGWTGQGSGIDFRMIAPGRQYVGKILFDIIDPAANHDKAALILGSAYRPKFPAVIRGIKVDSKFKRVFFLHGCGWSTGGELGRYRFHYEDNQFVDVPLINGRNIGDWWNCGDLPDAWAGIIAVNGLGHQVGLFVAEWKNPYPDKRIVRMDFISAGAEKEAINFNNTSTCVPFLVAVTGEEYRQ